MSIKTRIKRALAGFLREELLEYIGYNHEIPYMSLYDRFGSGEGIGFETVVMEESIPVGSYGGIDGPYTMEDYINRAKKRFAEQVMKHIHVEAQDLTNRESFMRRSVRFVLRVQVKRDR